MIIPYTRYQQLRDALGLADALLRAADELGLCDNLPADKADHPAFNRATVLFFQAARAVSEGLTADDVFDAETEWQKARDALDAADAGLEALGKSFTEAQMKAAGRRITDALTAYMAVPAPSLQHAIRRLNDLVSGERDMRTDVREEMPRLVAEALQLSEAA